VNREARVAAMRARLDGRESLAHEIEMATAWDDLTIGPAARRLSDSDAGKGEPPEPKPGTSEAAILLALSYRPW
jgi:hypothetical protein